MKTTKITLSILASLLTSYLGLAQNPGTLNANFGSNGYEAFDIGNKNQEGLAVAVQPDGKIIIGGIHEHTNNRFDWQIYRLTTDGKPDNTFSGDGQYSTSFSNVDYLTDIAVQPDGKIVICGYAYIGDTNINMVVHRIKADGTLDNTFGTGGTVFLDRSGGAIDRANRVIVAPNGKIYVGGYMTILGEDYFIVHRLNPNGSPDSTFSLDGNIFVDMNAEAIMTDMDVAADGSVILSGAIDDNGITKMVLIKIKNNGQLDDSFASSGVKKFTPGLNVEAGLWGVRFLPDGKIIGAGVKLSNGSDALIVRLEANGLYDATFNGNGYKVYDLANGATNAFTHLELLATGKMLLLAYTRINNIEKGVLVQLNSNGAIDSGNYGSGTGKLTISISNQSEDVNDLAVNNTYAYTVGSFMAGQHDDIFVSSSNRVNPVSIPENPLIIPAVKVFPNPATTMQPITVHLDEEIQGNVQIDVYSMAGQQIYHEAFYKASEDYQHVINLTNSNRGVYLVRITNGEKTGTQKLIIQ